MYPTYYFIHFRAADYYLPRWHGSKQKLRKFVNAAVDKSKDKEGLTLYTRIYWSQLWALKENTFSNGYAEWPMMKQGFEDIIRDYPSSTWNLNAYAYYSCMAKDWATTRKLVKKIGNDPHLSIWESKSKYYTCKSYAENNYQNIASDKPANVVFGGQIESIKLVEDFEEVEISDKSQLLEKLEKNSLEVEG